METKLSKLKNLMGAGEWQKAISLASKFPRLGDERDAIKRAQMAYTNPTFCKQIGGDPFELMASGQAALIKRYMAS